MPPKASIVYLTKNGGELFRRSLEAVFAQNVDFPFEVIVIDSGSSDNTLELAGSHPVRLYTIPPEEFNFGLTRDYGFRLAQGEILISLSQDAIPVGCEWLRRMVEPFNDVDVSVVQGRDVLPEDREVFFWDRVGLFYYTAEHKRWIRQYNHIGLSFTNCAIRRSAWEKHPLGRVEMNEDKVFQEKMIRNGYRIVRQNRAMAYHSHLYTVASLAKRCENEGIGWRGIGVTYSIRDLLDDMTETKIWSRLIRALFAGRIRRMSELLFPIMRPVFLYKGNRSTGEYVK